MRHKLKERVEITGCRETDKKGKKKVSLKKLKKGLLDYGRIEIEEIPILKNEQSLVYGDHSRRN